MKSNVGYSILKIWMDPDICKGCLCCELACSFHKSGNKLFNPAISSTKVLRDNDTARMVMIIDGTCDRCLNEDMPLCVKYCPFSARGVVV